MHYLQRGQLFAFSGQNLAERFGGSAMTWSRTLTELVALGAGEEAKLHKFRYFRFALPPDNTVK
ncbi:MAG: hypothetical protein PHC61_12820 [Chitinivibrionales bacterium]|nr:hypothetical protein [Chitinivibrionales bacterium]